MPGQTSMETKDAANVAQIDAEVAGLDPGNEM